MNTIMTKMHLRSVIAHPSHTVLQAETTDCRRVASPSEDGCGLLRAAYSYVQSLCSLCVVWAETLRLLLH